MLPYAYWSAAVQKRFARFQSMAPDVPPSSDDPNRAEKIWRDLREGRWLDPVMMILYAFDTLRRRDVDEARDSLVPIVEILRRYFPGIPDTEAIAKAVGIRAARPPSDPTLLLEGSLVLGVTPATPRGMRLDYEGMWTLWRGEQSDTIDRPRARARTITVSPFMTAGAARQEEVRQPVPG